MRSATSCSWRSAQLACLTRPDAGVGPWGFQIVGSSAVAREAVTGRASVPVLQGDARPYIAIFALRFGGKQNSPRGLQALPVSDERQQSGPRAELAPSRKQFVPSC
jgi:hypothetical protein